MIEAGTGFRMPPPQEPVDPEMLQAQAALRRIMPASWLRAIERMEQHGDAVEQLAGRAPELMSTTDQIWARHGRETLQNVYSGLAEAYGTDELSEEQSAHVGRAFISWLQSDQRLLHRYEQGDPAVVTEFVNSWRTGFVEPARRVAQAPGARAAAGNRNLPPAARPSGVVPPAVPAPSTDPGAVHDRAWQQFSELQRQSG